MHSILLFSLVSLLPLSLQGPEPQEAAPSHRHGGKKVAAVAATPLLALVPRDTKGVWLDEEGEPSLDLTALALIALARRGNTMRAGPQKQAILRGVLALKQRKPGTETGQAEITQEVLTALGMSIHERLASFRLLKRYVTQSMDRAFSSERLDKVFPENGLGSPSQDVTRLLYLLLFQQIQISTGSGIVFVRMSTPTAKVDTERMRSWLHRGLKDTNADAERLLILFLGHLVLDPPKEPPLVASPTGFLWKRAHRIMQADQKKSGGELPPRLLFLDTLLRAEFLTDAFPKTLRESRKARLEIWEKQFRDQVPQTKGLSHDDFYRLMTLAELRGRTPLWQPPAKSPAPKTWR